MFNILYQDDHYVAIYKPPSIHVHRSAMAPHEPNCMVLLRDQLERWVYPLHRLDRATCGVLLFGLDAETARRTSALFSARTVKKRYLAIVRGYLPPDGEIDRPIRETPEKPPAEARTTFRCLQKIELPFPTGEFATSRYSLVEIFPKTGRRHQIRRHFAGISHPIIGDVLHGDGRHNRLFRDKFAIHRLLLIAHSLEFTHPFSAINVHIFAKPDNQLLQLFAKLDLKSFF